MIQKVEVSYIPASELQHANLLETVHYCIFFSTLHHSDLGKKNMKLN